MNLKLFKKFIKRTIGYDSKIVALRKEAITKRKLNVGAGGVSLTSDWFSCDRDLLDLTKRDDWKRLLGKTKMSNIFAEHVWEHLSDVDTELANKNCYNFLRTNGKLRIAVPDGYHINTEYIEWVKVGGIGPGADDHKILYNYKTLRNRLESVGFKVQLVEYWDEFGKFNSVSWDIVDGKVSRSKEFDSRNTDGNLNYTSLIIDAIK